MPAQKYSQHIVIPSCLFIELCKKEATQLIELASQETQGESQNLLKALLWAMQDREAKQAREIVVYLALFSKEYASSDFR